MDSVLESAQPAPTSGMVAVMRTAQPNFILNLLESSSAPLEPQRTEKSVKPLRELVKLVSTTTVASVPAMSADSPAPLVKEMQSLVLNVPTDSCSQETAV